MVLIWPKFISIKIITNYNPAIIAYSGIPVGPCRAKASVFAIPRPPRKKLKRATAIGAANSKGAYIAKKRLFWESPSPDGGDWGRGVLDATKNRDIIRT